MMTELFRLVEPPRECSYLPAETASLSVHAVNDMSGAEYAELLSRGYRRFGMEVFRPACPACRQCRSVRILAQDFEPNASERRVLRKNENIRAELHPLFVTPQHIDLYNRYHGFMHGHREWPRQRINHLSYRHQFLAGASHTGRQWLYFKGDQLIGVALVDEVPGAVSLVYCYYDPDWRPQSPGIFSVLTQILYAQRQGLPYAYLGYWVEACQSMSYKGRFQPREVLREYPEQHEVPIWTRG